MRHTATKTVPSRPFAAPRAAAVRGRRAPRIELVLVELRRLAPAPLIHRHVKTREVRQ